MRHIVIGVICTLILSSCAVYNYTQMEPDFQTLYVGQSYGDIISSKGAPNREMSDGNGGKVLIYERYYSDSYTNYYQNINFSTTSTVQNREYLEIYINSDGLCYNVKSNMLYKEINWWKTIRGNLLYLGLVIGLCGLAALAG